MKERSARNHTICLTEQDRDLFGGRLCFPEHELTENDITDKTYNADLLDVIGLFPQQCVDLMIIDPPYNLTKKFGETKFKACDDATYEKYLETWFPHVVKLLKKDGSLYICGDWKSTSALYRVTARYLTVRNRITWQREKGRGAVSNWKNCSEDIWFATAGEEYCFNAEAVKQKRRVIAPYHADGKPKDWEETEDGKFRLTGASNFWDDITVPYWSMSENTDHPTQKPEKLMAKLILASSKAGDLVFDPFLGSGTVSVVAKKLGRRYCGIEVDTDYCLLAEKRLARASDGASIQGYSGGVFWDRNTGKEQCDERRIHV